LRFVSNRRAISCFYFGDHCPREFASFLRQHKPDLLA